MIRLMYATTIAACLCCATSADAQITQASNVTAGPVRTVTLEERLNSRLKATAADQRGFIRFVGQQVRQGKLEARLVFALERYAVRRNRGLPFPFFARSMRIEAAKRGVNLPEVRTFATTKKGEG